MSSLPIARPSKIVCVGLNYRDHAEETSQTLPERPILFAKWPNVLVGPGEPIQLPRISSKIDYEAELGVVIGERVKGASAAHALDSVAGYVCFNDVSARDLQRAEPTFVRGKALDTFGPVGPRLVPSSEIRDPQSLRIRCVLNGQTMQDSSTANMIFSVAELIAYITEAITLEAGDLIVTGTPSGVGYVRKPPVYLKAGDEVTIEIEGIGALTNPVVGPA